MSGKNNRDRLDASTRQDQRDEIIADLMRTHDRGERVDRNQWLTRYPEFANDLKQFFQKQDQLEALVSPLRKAAAQALNVRCPHCNNPIELLDDAPLEEVSCPSCGSSFSLVAEKTITHYSPGEKTIGHFQLLDRVGIGAFGSVWKARDTQLDRIVAVKIPRNAQLDESQTELFLRDARAAAQLKHPNIVGVHEVGKQDDTIYIVSDFIQGASLKEWVVAKRLLPRETAQLCVKIAKALHHAHESGVIHRDLKPGNIMMDTTGDPHIVDFGLAKREAGEITMTVDGQILGTPAYMSPEQARGEGHAVDRGADIYSLGVILFELLTGELPFRGDKHMLILQILEDDPPSPHKLNSGLPHDLETICLKCLEKDPARRYLSAWDLAEDFRRFLSSEPIHARRSSLFERSRKWAKRRPAVAALVAVSAVAICAVISALSISNLLIQSEHEKTKNANRNLETEKEKTRTAMDALTIQQAATRSALLEKTTAYNEKAVALNVEQRTSYFRAIQLSEQEWRSNNLVHADQILENCRAKLRGWEWYWLKRISFGGQLHRWQGFVGQNSTAPFSPDGSQMALVGPDRKLMVVDVESGQVQVTFEEYWGGARSLAFSPNRPIIAVAAQCRGMDRVMGQHVTLLDTESGEVIRQLKLPEGQTPQSVAFLPDGIRLIVLLTKTDVDEAGKKRAISDVRMWDITTGTELGTKLSIQETAHGFALSPNGKKFAITNGKSILVCQTEDGKHLHTLEGHGDRVQGLAIYGDKLASAGTDRTIKIWDLSTGQRQRTLIGHQGIVHSVAISPDGKRVASASQDRTVRIWDLRSGLEINLLRSPNEGFNTVAFCPDGNRLVTGTWCEGQFVVYSGFTIRKGQLSGTAGEVKIWDANSPPDARSLVGHRGDVWDARFTPDGESLVTAGVDGTARLWHVASGKLVRSMTGHRGAIYGLDIDPTGRMLATAGRDRLVKLWDLADGELIASFEGHGGFVHSVAFDRRGVLLASGGQDKSIKIWDIENRELLRTINKHQEDVTTVRFSRHSDVLVSSSIDKTVRFWNPRTGEEAGNSLPHSGHVYSFAFNGDETQLATTSNAGQLECRGGFINTPDGLRRAALDATPSGTITLWDIPNGRELYRIPVPRARVYGISFSPDNRRISVTTGGAVRILDAATGEDVLTLRNVANVTHGVVFDSHGERLAVAATGGIVRVWDGRPLDVDFRLLIVGQHQGRGENLRTAGRPREAVEAFRYALGMLEDLLGVDPDSRALRASRANLNLKLGNVLKDLRQQKEATEFLSSAISEYQELVKEDPSSATARHGLAEALNNMAIFYTRQREPVQAEKAHQESLRLFADLADEFPGTSLYELGVVIGNSNLGQYLRDLGRLEEADDCHRQAQAMIERLVSRFPDVPRYRRLNAYCHIHQSKLFVVLGKIDNAESELQIAIEILKELVDDRPTVYRNRYDLAAAFEQLGILLKNADRFPEAEVSFKNAIRLHEPVARELPAVLVYRNFLATLHNNLGIAYFNQEKYSDAEEFYSNALRVRKKLATDFPKNLRFQINLAGSHCNLGHVQFIGKDDPSASLSWYAKAIEILTSVPQQPRHPLGQKYLYNAYEGRGFAYRKLEQYANAVSDFDEALEIGRHRNDYRLRIPRANLLLKLERYSAAHQAVEEIGADPKITGAKLFQLARIQAQIAAASENEESTAQHLDDAVNFLKRADEAGVFKRKSYLNRLSTDKDFVALRNRPEVQRIMSQVSADPGQKDKDD